MKPRHVCLPAAILGLAAGLAAPSSTLAGERACDSRVNNTFNKLLECVTLDGVRAHQAAFQAIADANGGTRAAGTPGYDASVDYVAQTLEAAGYDVVLQPFEVTFAPEATLTQLTPIAADYETGAFTGTGFGEAAGPVIAVDLALGTPDWPADPSTSTSGCEASDFAGLDFSGPSDVALIQRGTCFFSTKAANAEAAGAEAVVIMNQGNTPEREGLIIGNASTFPDGTPSNLTKPLVGASFFDGIALSQTGSAALVRVDPPVTAVQTNVLAQSFGRVVNNTIMAGAHLDSVNAGPGIQDNGSGSAALLETAVQMAKVKPVNTVRFAWWGAEESGLVGSTAYVNSLSSEELEQITLYLNFDMIGSPNYVFFVYDGDGSESGIPGAPGSDQIEYLFEHYYTQAGQPFKAVSLAAKQSAHFAFVNAGVPVGGIFTGDVGIKTDEEAALWGGTAGEQYDPCYHLACDTFDNISLQALEVNADAVAYSVLQYAMNTEAINGERGKGNFKMPPAPAMPTE
jgi:Zn-dependent M28 family amino/carboxypeptidase